MRRSLLVAFAIVASLLAITAAPASAASTNIAVGSAHTTDADFNNATTLENVSVVGSGDDARATLSGGTGQVSKWPFDDDTDTSTATDAWGDNDGSITGATYTSDAQSGKALDFDGSGDGVDVPHDSSLNTPDGITISVWVNHDTTADHRRVFVSKGDINNDELGIFVNRDGLGIGTAARLKIDGSRVELTRGQDSDDLNGKWVLWTVTYNGTHAVLYQNDTAIDTEAVTGSISTNSETLQFGRDSSNGYDYDGSLDDPRWMDRGVSSDEVSELYNNPGDDLSGETGTYVSATHSVDDAESGFTNLTLSDAEAEVTWLADTNGDGTFETEAASSTFSTTGNHTLDLTGTDSTDWRVNVTFVSTGGDPSADLHDEGVTFTNPAPEAANATASPAGASTNNEDVELSIDVSDGTFPTAQGDSVNVEFFVDGASIGTETITSNGTVSRTATGLANGSHTWHVELDDDYGGTGASDTFTFDVLHYAPELDNSSATPSGGAQLTSREVDLSIDLEDVDFAETSGDSVDVEFFVDGSSVGTESSVTSNGTVTHTAQISGGGSHTWRAEATDEYGLTETSDTFSMQVPGEIEIRNETGANGLVDEATVEGRFFSGELIFDREVADGTIDMTGLDADREYVLTVEAEGYYSRTVVVESLYEQSTVYLLRDNNTAHLTEFTIDDQTGDFPAASSKVRIEKPINRSGTTNWTTIAGDYFGAEGSFKVHLQNSTRYNISVENDAGEVAELGPYTADSAGIKQLTISEQGTITIDELGAAVGFEPSVGVLGTANATVLNASIRSDQDELDSYRWVVTHTNDSGTTELVNLSGTQAGGESFGTTVNLTGLEDGELESNVSYTLTSGSTFAEAVEYTLRTSLGGDATILAVAEDTLGRFDSSTADQVAALLAMVMIVIAVAAVASSFHVGTEVLGLMIAGGVAAFAALGFLEWSVFFAVSVGWVAIAAVRRGL